MKSLVFFHEMLKSPLLERKILTFRVKTNLSEKNDFRETRDISIESNFVCNFTAIKIQSFVSNTFSQ